MSGRQVRRLVRAYVRDTRVLVHTFRYPLLFFALLLLLGTLVLRLAYHPAARLPWGEALHMALKLMFFETVAPYPVSPVAQMVFVLWPVLGMALAVDGIVRFGTALFNRQGRKEAWQVAVASTYREHIVVCGMGKVGYRVTLQLLRMQQQVVGIERDAECAFVDRVRREGVPVLLGDARDRDLLEKAGVGVASAIVACTDDDLANLEVALEGRELNPDLKVVLRMFDQALAERMCRGFGIHTAFSTSALAAPALAAAATRAAVEYSFYVDDVLLNVSRLTVADGSPLTGGTVGEVEQELDLSIIFCRDARGVDYHPPGDKVLEGGDQIVVSASLPALASLERMNLPEGESAPRRRGRRTSRAGPPGQRRRR